MATIYVRTTMTIPGVGAAIHVAELDELNATACTMQRLIALDPQGTIAGIAKQGAKKGNIDMPQTQVPHPNTYGDYKDISAEEMTQDEFEGLWTEATTKYPGL